MIYSHKCISVLLSDPSILSSLTFSHIFLTVYFKSCSVSSLQTHHVHHHLLFYKENRTSHKIKFLNFPPPVTILIVCNNFSPFLLLCTVFIATYFFYAALLSVFSSWFTKDQGFHILKQSSNNFTYLSKYKNILLIWSDL